MLNDDRKRSPPPSGFSEMENDKSFNVQEFNGAMLILQNGLSRVQERDRASATLQMQFDGSGNVGSTFIISDDRSPTLQAVVQSVPQQGFVVATSGSVRPQPGLIVEAEATASVTSLMGLSLTAKHRIEDFRASLSLRKQEHQGSSIDFSYMQWVSDPNLMLGCKISTPVSTWLPLPAIGDIGYALHAVLQDDSADNVLLAKFAPAEGGASLRYWHAEGKRLSLGAVLNYGLQDGSSKVGVGAKLGLAADPSGQPMTTVTVNATTDMRTQVGLQHINTSLFSGTMMLIGLNGTMDHKQQDHKLGLQVQLIQ